MNRARLNKMVGYVRALGCLFDTGDARDDLATVLGAYGFACCLSPEERAELVAELEELAERRQTAEMVLQVGLDDPLLPGGGDPMRYLV